MNKPIGATQQQLDEHNIEWVLCGNYGHRDTQEPQWALRHSSEYEWAKERTMLLQEIANLKRQLSNLDAKNIDIEEFKKAAEQILKDPAKIKQLLLNTELYDADGKLKNEL